MATIARYILIFAVVFGVTFAILWASVSGKKRKGK
jgi:hypothetical protein